MTLICALRRGGETWIGSDQYGTFADGVRVRTGPKWILGAWAIGHAGALRAKNLIQANMECLSHNEPFEVANAIRELLHTDRWSILDRPGDPENYDQNWILASGRGVWVVDASFSIVPSKEFVADGSGRDYALGAAAVAEGGPKQVLEAAIRATVKLVTHCGGKPWVRKL